MVRLLLVLSLGFVLSSTVDVMSVLNSGEQLLFIIFTEFLIGMSLAFGFHSASAAAHTMGQLVDLQMGFSAASIFDPSSQEIASPTGELLGMAVVIVFLSLNIHHDLLQGFAVLLEVLPPGSSIVWRESWLGILGVIYLTAFIVVSPLILSLWLIDFSMAFISRSLPQAPVYFIGLPVKVGLGILLVSWFLGQAMEPVHRLLTEALFSWNLMFKV